MSSKFSLFLVSAVMMFDVAAFAQSRSTGNRKSISPTSTPTNTAAPSSNQSALPRRVVDSDKAPVKGLRLSLIKPSWNLDLTSSTAGRSSTASTSPDDSLGIAVGYASLPIRQMGWLAGGSLLQYKAKVGTFQATYGMVRAEGSLAYTFANRAYVRGGLNLSKYYRGFEYQSFDPALGLQAGGGFHLNRNLGIDVAYVVMDHRAALSGEYRGTTLNIKEAGLELAITGTF